MKLRNVIGLLLILPLFLLTACQGQMETLESQSELPVISSGDEALDEDFDTKGAEAEAEKAQNVALKLQDELESALEKLDIENVSIVTLFTIKGQIEDVRDELEAAFANLEVNFSSLRDSIQIARDAIQDKIDQLDPTIPSHQAAIEKLDKVVQKIDKLLSSLEKVRDKILETFDRLAEKLDPLIEKVTRKDPTGILKGILQELKNDVLTRLRLKLEEVLGL